MHPDNRYHAMGAERAVKTPAVKPFVFSWTNTETRLRYSVSDYSLFSLRITGKTFAVPLEPLLPPTFKADLQVFLRSAPADASLLCIRNLPIDRLLPRLQTANKKLQYTLNQSYQYYVDLSGSFADYLASLSGKTRSTLKRKLKKFASLNDGDVDWRVYSRPDEMAEYHRLARQVAVKTYQERLFRGALPADERFVTDIRNLAAVDRARGYLLFLNGSPIAYLYLPIRDGVVEYTYLGYDPAYAAMSPGSVLLYCALDDLFSEQRYSYFDFSYGAGQTKEVFCTGKYLRADIFYFTESPKHYATVCSHIALDATSHLLGRVLERMNLRMEVKRLLRHGGAEA